MKISDLNGLVIEVKNLQLAILQADDFRHYRHADPEMQAADDKLQVYWEDIYQKLLALQMNT